MKSDSSAWSTALGDDGWVTLDLPELPWRVQALVVLVHMRPELLGLRLEPRIQQAADGSRRFVDNVSALTISADRLRRLPLRKIRAATSSTIAGNCRDVAAIIRSNGRQRLPLEHFNAVAAVYKAAISEGKHPLPEVQRVWSVSRGSAAKYVSRARELGALGYPERPGVAGASCDTSPIRNEP